MTDHNILLLGATGSIGKVLRQELLANTDAHLTLFSRSAHRLKTTDTAREKLVTGDVLDAEMLAQLIAEHDAVFAALSGDLEAMARSIVEAMTKAKVERLVFITSMGIYDEIPAHVGSGNLSTNPMLQPYRKAADIIEQSTLNYTIIRPGWFDNQQDQTYEITVKGEPFGGHDVSRASIAHLSRQLLLDPTLYGRNSIGIHRA